MKKVLLVLSFYQIMCAGSWPLEDFFKQARASTAYYAGDMHAAQNKFEQLVVEHPTDLTYVRGLADSFYAQGNFKQALGYYQQSLMSAHDRAEQEQVYFNAGCAQAQLREFKDALISFEKVVELNNKNERAQKNIEILKKLLEEQKQQPQKDKQQKNDQKNNQKDKQDSPGKDQQNKSDSQESQKDKSEKNDKKDGENQQHDRNQKNNQGDQKQQNQPGNNQPQQEPERNAQNEQSKKHEQSDSQQRQPQHAQSPQQQSLSQQNATKPPEKQLDKKMAALLTEVDKLDQYGQHLYLQALAGQHAEQKRREHDW